MELAKIAGKSNLVDEIRVKIQETKVSNDDFKEFSFEVQIPREKIDQFLKPFKVTSNWKEGFDILGSNLPPTGDYKVNLEEVNQQINESPIRFLSQNIIYDRNNLPIQRSTTLEESKEIALIQNETFKIGGFAQFIPSIFKTLLDKHGMPTNEELNDCFSSTLINEELSIIISEATLKYLNGRYKASCFLLIPVIETIIREMVKGLGLAIYKGPNGIRPGGVYTLGHLFSQLEGRLNESWRRYIKNILIEPLSLNLRNEICHGLLVNPGIEEASLLLHITSYLRLLRISHNPDQSEE